MSGIGAHGSLSGSMSFYVTTPIYYVNAAPHLGHAYSTIAADVMARHMRQRGEDVFFLTGTDEHGEPVALAAEREGVTPQELVDRNAPRFIDLMPQLNVSNDFFIRTTDPEHMAKVQEVLGRVRDNGHVYEGVYEGWYCPRCADFKTDAEAGDDNLCPIHRTPLTREKEDNYFFRLSAFQDDLLQPARRAAGLRHAAPPLQRGALVHRVGPAGRVAQPLDVHLGRAACRGTTSHVFYVWFDALLNYYTALSYARPGEDLTERFWPAQFHLIGKDILKFHTVFWPAMLMAAGLPLPEHVFVHGFLLIGKDKMGKSAGNAIDPFAIMDEYGTDALRYYLMREVSFGQDGAVSIEGFAVALRVRARQRPRQPRQPHDRDGPPLPRRRRCPTPSSIRSSRPRSTRIAGEVCALLDRADLTGALDAIWLRVRRLNRYVEEQAPWTLAKDPERAGELDRVLASLAEGAARRRASCCTRGSRRARQAARRARRAASSSSRARACRPAASARSPSSSRCSPSRGP